jgi:crotonobetainyl-CoA:carnitine CoA-transferase CaiB-like acyl-CoA transferase
MHKHAQITGLMEVPRVVSIEEFAEDPQVRARAHLVSLPHALSGTTVFESSPFVLQRTPAQYPRSAPFFGRDNTQILRETLGLDAEKIEELRQSGALT